MTGQAGTKKHKAEANGRDEGVGAAGQRRDEREDNRRSQEAGQDTTRGKVSEHRQGAFRKLLFAKQAATNGTLYRVITVGD